MAEVDITVILTVYNQSVESIEKSMRSIADQKGCTFSLVVADDHSDEDLEGPVTQLAQSLGIERFAYVRHSQNVKTVRNILQALPAAEGEYAKAMGAGDMLYDDETLAAIVKFCHQYDVKIGFGGIVMDTKGSPVYGAPRTPDAYPPRGAAGPEARRALLLGQLDKADWIPGCCQFYRRDYIGPVLATLADQYGDLYAEDFAALVALFDTDVYCLDRPILIYEWGTGISTAGSLAARQRLYADHRRLYDRLVQDHPHDRHLALSRRWFKAREFLALKTPIYSLLQRIVAKGYVQDGDARA